MDGLLIWKIPFASRTWLLFSSKRRSQILVEEKADRAARPINVLFVKKKVWYLRSSSIEMQGGTKQRRNEGRQHKTNVNVSILNVKLICDLFDLDSLSYLDVERFGCFFDTELF